jgi:hypothetical protein
MAAILFHSFTINDAIFRQARIFSVVQQLVPHSAIADDIVRCRYLYLNSL